MSEDMKAMFLKGQIVGVGDGEIVVGVRLCGEDRELRIPALREDQQAAGHRLYQYVIVKIEIMAWSGEDA